MRRSAAAAGEARRDHPSARLQQRRARHRRARRGRRRAPGGPERPGAGSPAGAGRRAGPRVPGHQRRSAGAARHRPGRGSQAEADTTASRERARWLLPDFGEYQCAGHLGGPAGRGPHRDRRRPANHHRGAAAEPLPGSTRHRAVPGHLLPRAALDPAQRGIAFLTPVHPLVRAVLQRMRSRLYDGRAADRVAVQPVITAPERAGCSPPSGGSSPTTVSCWKSPYPRLHSARPADGRPASQPGPRHRHPPYARPARPQRPGQPLGRPAASWPTGSTPPRRCAEGGRAPPAAAGRRSPRATRR